MPKHYLKSKDQNTKYSSSMKWINLFLALLKVILKWTFGDKFFLVNSQNITALRSPEKRKQVIAAFLNYLCFARIGQNIQLPGEYLNSCLIDMDKQLSPKKPTLVKMKRSSNFNSILILN